MLLPGISRRPAGLSAFARLRLIVFRPLVALGIVAMGLSIGALPLARATVPITSCRYFIETGHYVCSQFLAFYEARGAAEIFGYPLTEPFVDARSGLTVQYFQRARLEYHPDQEAGHRIQLGSLVDELGYAFPRLPGERIPRLRSALQQYFHKTGHVVSFAFLAFFLEHGGLGTFGYPLSEALFEDGHTVQYFERFRMEWHPEAMAGPEIRLSNLGETYLERFAVGEDAREPLPPPPEMIASGSKTGRLAVSDLHVTASVASILTARSGEQTVHVFVSNQQGQPVLGASSTLEVQYEDGGVAYLLPLTDEGGHAEVSFELGETQPGRRVVIEVVAAYGDVAGETDTFFLAWW